jgi:hypothetical protein
MKNFLDFLNEAKIRGTKGIPTSYISDVDRRAREEMGGRANPQEIMMLLGRVTELTIGDVANPMNFFTGRLSQQERLRVRQRFSELEQLAEQVIRSNYGSILDNVDLDIKLVQPGQVGEFMDENSTRDLTAKPEIEKERETEIKRKGDQVKRQQPEQPGQPQSKEMTQQDVEGVKSGIDRQKIANLITQGEAKNTKKLLHTEEVKDGLDRIFGRQKARQIFDLWDQITKMADKLDWQIPIEVKARMMEDQPQGMAGACACEWPDAPDASDDEKDSIKNSIENGEDPIENNSEEIESLLSQGNPKIKAVGVDFPMLLHESIKGIYQMIMAVAIPEDPTIATLVKLGTSSFEDEAEDFRYGPYIAADIRDFIFKNPKSTEYPNIREFVNGKIMELPDEQFFSLIEKILISKVEKRDNPEARKMVDDIIDDCIKMLKDYDYQQAMPKEEEPEVTQGGDEELSDIDKLISQANEPDQEGERLMTKSELQEAIDDALDSGDMEAVKRLGAELSKRFPN